MSYTENALEKQKENILNRMDEMNQNITERLRKSGISLRLKEILSTDCSTALKQSKDDIDSALYDKACSQVFKTFGDVVAKINNDIDNCEVLLRKHHENYHRLSFHATALPNKNTSKIHESPHDHQYESTTFFNLW